MLPPERAESKLGAWAKYGAEFRLLENATFTRWGEIMHCSKVHPLLGRLLQPPPMWMLLPTRL